MKDKLTKRREIGERLLCRFLGDYVALTSSKRRGAVFDGEYVQRWRWVKKGKR